MSLQYIFFFLLIPILIWSFNTFDNLIKLEYEKFHQYWIKDGNRQDCIGVLLTTTRHLMVQLLLRRPC
jgi:hypothetical protein